MSKKELLAKLLYHSGLLAPAAALSPKSILILTYHRIRPNGPVGPDQELFDEKVFGPTQREFEAQVKWLKGNFDVLSEESLLNALREKTSYRGRYVAITFDDGYLDNYTLAYPVLRAHSAPAMFFVCPGLINSRTIGWWDAIAYLVKKSERPAITICGETIRLGEEKEAAIHQLTSWMKLRPYRETANLIPQLAQACEVEFPDPGLQSRQFMTWDQIIEVNRGGVDIGSHTFSHPVLATLDEESQLRELRESKAALEARLSRPIRTLAYPVGGYEHFTPRTMRLAKQAGYEFAFSAQTGYNLPDAQPFNIRRIVSNSSFDAMFACSTVFPSVFSWLRPMPASHRIEAEATPK